MGPADIVVTGISSATAITLAWIAKQNRDIKATADTNTEKVQEIKGVADRIEARTNGELDRKIRKAITEVFADHKDEVTQAVMTEAIRDLLDAMLSEGSGQSLDRKGRREARAGRTQDHLDSE